MKNGREPARGREDGGPFGAQIFVPRIKHEEAILRLLMSSSSNTFNDLSAARSSDIHNERRPR